MKKKHAAKHSDYAGFLRFFTGAFCACLIFGLLVLYPFGALWIHASGDNAVERVVAAQANGEYAVFGSGISQDFADYKLRLYQAVKPEIASVGSSRVMQFRGSWFSRPFVNMGGAAGNLSVLRSTIDAMLAAHRPRAIILGVDFWWFMPNWEKNPEASRPVAGGSYNYGLENVKKPWLWLLQGKISLHDFFRPFLGIFGAGFKSGRYGILAQQYDEGFGPDGAWNYTGEATGLKAPFDYRFRDTLAQVAYGMKAFYHAQGQEISRRHVEAFADIVMHLRARGVETFVFIPPLAPQVYAAMLAAKERYPHFFGLKNALARYGIDAADFADPASVGSSRCEFVDGFHGGAVAYARILRRMAAFWPALAQFVNIARLDEIIGKWRDHVTVGDGPLATRPEADFMDFGCVKNQR